MNRIELNWWHDDMLRASEVIEESNRLNQISKDRSRPVSPYVVTGYVAHVDESTGFTTFERVKQIVGDFEPVRMTKSMAEALLREDHETRVEWRDNVYCGYDIGNGEIVLAKETKDMFMACSEWLNEKLWENEPLCTLIDDPNDTLNTLMNIQKEEKENGTV